jgi:N-formylglutamate amidohydrolase
MHLAAVVVHIPHASRLVPDEGRAALLLSDADLAHELLCMTDAFTDELFAVHGATAVRFPVSRLVVDPERFTNDAQEPMSSRGMGVIYTKRASGELLREAPSAPERAQLLSRWYTPHHEVLTRAVDNALRAYDTCLVLDAHSFPSRPLPYELVQDPDRPEICLGTDPYHTPSVLLEQAVAAFSAAGFTVRVNSPFSGALVPLAHYQRDPRVLALMVEVRRDVYMNEQTGHGLPDFASTAARVQRVVRELIAVAG